MEYKKNIYLHGQIIASYTLCFFSEPLYQVYNAEVNEEHHRLSKKKDDKENNNICPDILHGGKSIRMLWEELPAVRTSGFLESITDEERKRQEVRRNIFLMDIFHD